MNSLISHIEKPINKLTGGVEQMSLNGREYYDVANLTDRTLYASPYLVANGQNYTKHYFIETERVCSKIGGGFGSIDPMSNWVEPIEGDIMNLSDNLTAHVANSLSCSFDNALVQLEPQLNGIEDFINLNQTEDLLYFTHSDHLGSSSFITDLSGDAVQHLQYLPFGESFVTQTSTSWQTRYTFSGKEKDDETGYNYFGARYYDSDLSVFISVDRFTDKYPSLTPYQYAGNNPVKYIDINGDSVVDSKGNIVNITVNNNNGNYTVSFDFAAGTSDEVKKVFMENGGKLIEGMALTETGRSYIQKAKVSEEKIYYSIVEGTEDEPRMGDGGAVVGGTTKDVKKDGVYQYTQITVYEGSARYWKKRNKHDQNNLTYFQKMVTNAVHETHHAVSQPDISARKAGRRLTTKEHEGAYNAGHDTAFDFGILNGAYDEKIKK